LPARRLTLLAGIAGGALLTALACGAHEAAAASSADMGGWGDAWGDDAAPEAPAPRARAPQPTPAPVSTAPGVHAEPLPAGPSATEIGGWGNAWGDDGAAATALPAVSRPRPAMSAAQEPAPTITPVAVTNSRGPSANDIGGWAEVWDAPAASQPSRTAQVAPAPTSPVPPSVAPAANAPAPDAAATQGPRFQAEVPVGKVSQAVNDDQEAPTGSATKRGKGKGKHASGDDEAEPPVQLAADQIIYDRELGIVSARGKVEIVQAGRMLVADQVSYNLKQDIVSASGNVTLAEPTGETMFTDYIELTGDFKEGIANEIRVVLADNSRMAAASARRVGGTRTDFDKGIYTACEPCRSHPERTPLWQAKAERVTHNQDDHEIEYRDAWIEMAGIPVAYTPYLSHPDPTVKRKSGFLTPTAGMSTNIGTNVTVPYFWAISDNQDITFAPRFLLSGAASTGSVDTSSLTDDSDVLRHVVLAGEHRWRGTQGEERTVASLTADRHDGHLRGHIDSKARYELDSNWRSGYELQRSTDDTYTAVYSYHLDNERPWLTTRPYLEGFGRRGYTLAEGYAFQGLRAQDVATQSPIVLPHIASTQITTPDDKGGYYTFYNDLLSYTRSAGIDSTRVSSTAAWNRPFYGSLGDVTTISTSMRADAYHSSDMPDQGTTNAGRAIPQISANWRMPFANRSQTLPQVIEPMAMVAASPNGGNSEKIPNEDAIGFELDEINVFQPNRFPGLDRVEGGVRGAYGLRWQAFPTTGSWIGATVAQGWRLRDDSTFPVGAGFDDKLSDYLARLDFSPNPFVSVLNRVRLDKNHGDMRREESSVSVGSPALLASVSYLYYERTDDLQNPFPRQHYITWALSSALTRYWTFYGGVSYSLLDEGGPTGWQTKLIYNDECFAFVTDMRRNFTSDRDFLAGYSLTFNLVFKTLGDVPFNVF
jgi:LPS-assembly protein